MSTGRTWRELLSGAGPGDWPLYREALDAFREVPPVLVFSKLQALGDEVVAEVEGLERSPSAGTWHKVFSSSWQRPPDWLHIELFVHIWATQHQQPVRELLEEWAAGYRRCGGDPGPRFTSSAPIPAAVRRKRLPRGPVLLGGVAVAAVVAASIAFWPEGKGSAVGLEKKKVHSSAPVSGVPSATAGPKGPLLLTTSWPTIANCDGATSVAMPVGGDPLSSFLRDDQDFRVPVAANGGGTWGSGHLYLTLSAKPGKTLIIEDIRPASRYPKRIDPPAWVATVQGGCGDTYGRVFDFNLDKPDLIDRGVVGQRYDGDPPAPTSPLGPGFTVSTTDPAMIRVDVQACKGNYEWSLLVNYSYDGQKFSKSIGPFRSMSVAGKGTAGYKPDQSTGRLTKDTKPGPAPTSAVGCPAPVEG